jgi:hypothetical protein
MLSEFFLHPHGLQGDALLGRAGYAPEARGMAAALAYVDDFLPIHDLHSLQALATRLGRIGRRKGARGPAEVPSSVARGDTPRPHARSTQVPHGGAEVHRGPR